MNHQFNYQTLLICPDCHHQRWIEMPKDRCVLSFDCEGCANILRPKAGDCCVFCSFGTIACPPIQQQRESKFQKGLKLAFILSLITIFYNTIEGVVSTFFGASDETLALFGFGVDSFAEVLSGIGVAHMVWRMQHSEIKQRDNFEITSLRITGAALFILVAGLITGAILSIINDSEPITTTAGIIISVLSIATMYFLYREKMKVGRQLKSEPIISDAHCTKTCFYLSFILLASSLVYAVWQIPYIDAIGSLGIAWYAWKEGKEAFNKAKTKRLSCDSDCC